MKQFARLYIDLDSAPSPEVKTAMLRSYFGKVSGSDRLWSLRLLSGRKPKRLVHPGLLKNWALEVTGLSPWLYEESYQLVGDVAETISLMLPLPKHQSNKTLSHWMTFLLSLEELNEFQKKESIMAAWSEMDQPESFVFLKLLTGTFRVNVPQHLIVKALAELTGTETAVITHRLTKQWHPDEVTFEALLTEETTPDQQARPYPFCLASTLEGNLEAVGEVTEWQAEWKWDGIRAQLIKRNGELYLWTRGEDLVTDKFPELAALKPHLPDGVVLDGELLPFADGRPLPFEALQARYSRKNITAKMFKETPVVFVAYDLLEWQTQDIRKQPLQVRRHLLEQLTDSVANPSLTYSDCITFSSWEELIALRIQCRENYSEGLMLKRKSSSYHTGRRLGDWWKWKMEPLTLDAVLMYAQKGEGQPGNTFSEYTFGLWDGTQLIPFTRTEGGLTEAEIRDIDQFIRHNTLEKFGPVRTVKPELVFEIAFEGVCPSARHKSGVAVRFPRILRWRHDKPTAEANTIADLRGWLNLAQSASV